MDGQRQVLRCERGDYTTGIIGDPYGLPAELVDRCITWHEQAHQGHPVRIVAACGR